MSEILQLDYYYGIEAEQFSFYRVPRLLIKDERFKKLSSDAKLLYGLMLDRMSLSIKNKWFDDNNRAYIIYTINSIMEDLGCGKEKAVKVLAGLDYTKGIGLIEKVRRGLGKPDIIYVKNFASLEGNVDKKRQETLIKSLKSENQASRSQKTGLQEVGKSDLKKSENQTFGSSEIETQEVGESNPNYTKYNKTDLNYIEENYINPIIQSGSEKNDVIDDVQKCIELIKENISYNHHMQYDSYGEKELYDELFQVICEVVCVRRPTIRVAGEEYPYELVKSRFLKLESSHLEYVIECMKNTATKITNIKAYMITALYNATTTINHFYQQEVNHDMYGGGWCKKDII